jgi:hypothetical protein
VTVDVEDGEEEEEDGEEDVKREEGEEVDKVLPSRRKVEAKAKEVMAKSARNKKKRYQ